MASGLKSGSPVFGKLSALLSGFFPPKRLHGYLDVLALAIAVN